MLSDCAMNTVVDGYIHASGIRRRDVFLNLMIPFVVYGILANVHVPLCLGLENVIIPKFDPKQWPNYLKKYRPNHVLAVPAYVSPLLKDPKVDKMDLSFFVTVGVGGDGMTGELEQAINTFLRQHNSAGQVLKGCGLTEVCATAVTCFSKSSRPGSVGIPLPKNNLMIYDNDTQTELPGGQVGEICLQSPSRMLGYRGDPEATKDLFRVHADGSEWLHTGDL